MCKSFLKIIGKVLDPALGLVDDVLGRNKSAAGPAQKVGGPVVIPKPVLPSRPTVPVQKAVEKERVELKFGAEGLPSLITEKRRGRNYSAGASTKVATLGVRLGQ